MDLSIYDVNALNPSAFTAIFANIYEATPALAGAAYYTRPFADRASLVDAFFAAVDALDHDGLLNVLRRYPELGTAAPMTGDSESEQRRAGLTEAAAATCARIGSANAAYLQHFGFPFIIAIRGLGVADIEAALCERLEHTADDERSNALTQMKRIAELRITALVRT